MGAQFAAHAAGFDPAEGQTRIGADECIEHDEAGVEPGRELAGAAGAAREDRRAEAVGRGVRETDGIVVVARDHNRGGGPEQFLIGRGHAGADVGEQSGGVEKSPAGEGSAAEQKAGAAADAGGDLAVEIFAQIGARERTDVVGRGGGIPGAARGESGRDEAFEVPPHRARHDEAFGRRAALAGIDQAGRRTGLRGEFEVGIGEHEVGIAAAEFVNAGLQRGPRECGDFSAGTRAAGEGDGAHALIGDEGRHGGRAREKHLKYAGGQARALEHGLDGERTAGDVRRVFEEEGVAAQQGRRRGADDLPERKIPRHDGEHDAERFIDDPRIRWGAGRTFVGEERGPVVGEIRAGAGAFFDFAAGLGDGLAHLGGGEARELVAPDHEFARDGTEMLGARHGREGAPGALRGGGAGEGAFDGRARVLAIAGETAAGGGIDGDKRHGGRLVRPSGETNGIRRREGDSAAVFRSVPLRPVRASCEMPAMARSDQRPVTVHMIAEHVGVSASAVSTVLADRHEERRLAPATVEKIRKAVRDLGYVPNVAARRLRAHDPEVHHIELGILTSFEAPLFLVSRVLRQVQRMADARTGPGRKFSVSIAMFHAGRLREMAGLLNASRFNGVVITNTLPDDDAFLAATTLPYAVVVLGRRLPNYCCVLDTPGESGRRAAEILLGRGCRRPVVLTPALLTESTADRAAAFCATVLAQTGTAPARVVAAGFAPTNGAEALRAHLGAGRGCDGLYAVTDGLALGAYQAIKDADRRIPRDIAVVGVGDHEHADFFDPPLTCVGPSNETIVEQIVTQLFDLMNRRRVKPVETFVPPSVVMRASA